MVKVAEEVEEVTRTVELSAKEAEELALKVGVLHISFSPNAPE